MLRITQRFPGPKVAPQGSSFPEPKFPCTQVKNIYGSSMVKNIYGPYMAKNIYGPPLAKNTISSSEIDNSNFQHVLLKHVSFFTINVVLPFPNILLVAIQCWKKLSNFLSYADLTSFSLTIHVFTAKISNLYTQFGIYVKNSSNQCRIRGKL
jgi:hypothetical protein